MQGSAPNTRLERLGLPKDLLLGFSQTEQRHTLGQRQQLLLTFQIRYVLKRDFLDSQNLFYSNFFKRSSRSIKCCCLCCLSWFCGATLPYSCTQICIHARHRFSPSLVAPFRSLVQVCDSYPQQSSVGQHYSFKIVVRWLTIDDFWTEMPTIKLYVLTLIHTASKQQKDVVGNI